MFNHKLLKEAFSYNTSGNGKCYYGISVDNHVYFGERDWDTRWNLIKNCYNFKDKKFLDIGCNMGILLTYLKKFNELKSGVGVDEPDDMLLATNKRDTIKAAKCLANGFGVLDITFMQFDLNKENYENILGTDFDIVGAMSIYKWIDDKERFLKYLSNFDNVLYEGHDSDDIEIERFSKFGFKPIILGKTQTGVSYDPNNTRTLILFSK